MYSQNTRTYLDVFHLLLDIRLVVTDLGYHSFLERDLLFHLIHLVNLDFH